VAVFASVAVVLVAAVAIGSLEAVKHLGTDRSVLRITDETTVTSTPTTEAAAETPVVLYRANLERTGVYQSGGPSQLPKVLWKVLVASGRNEDVTSPAVSGGVAYFGSNFEGDDGCYLWAVK
jgi:hypothetical protein